MIKILPIVAALISTPLMAHEINGSVGVVSKYIDKGYVENDGKTIQAELEYSHGALYVGYFGSTLDYDPSDEIKKSSFEHDFYIGLSRDYTDNLTNSTHIATYMYKNGGRVYGEESSRKTTKIALVNELQYKNFTSEIEVNLSNDSFGNIGDTYLNFAYEQPIINDIVLNGSVGVYAFNQSSDSELVSTDKKLTLSDIKIGVSKTFYNVETSVNYIIGGKDRYGYDLDNNVVAGLKYKF